MYNFLRLYKRAVEMTIFCIYITGIDSGAAGCLFTESSHRSFYPGSCVARMGILDVDVHREIKLDDCVGIWELHLHALNICDIIVVIQGLRDLLSTVDTLPSHNRGTMHMLWLNGLLITMIFFDFLSHIALV